MKMTPTGALMRQAQTGPKNVAFVFHEELWTYERLAAEAGRLARGLAGALGEKPDESERSNQPAEHGGQPHDQRHLPRLLSTHPRPIARPTTSSEPPFVRGGVTVLAWLRSPASISRAQLRSA
jgi:hypothetical protein